MSSPKAPKAPDPKVVTDLQTQSNKDLFNYSVDAARVNTTNPYSTGSWTKTPTFNEEGYNSALAEWQRKADSLAAIKPGKYGGEENYFRVAERMGEAPSKDAFTTYDWTYEESLRPEQQKLLDSQTGAKQSLAELLAGGATRAGDALSQNMDFSGIPGVRTDIGREIPNSPQFNAQGPTVERGGVYSPTTQVSKGFETYRPDLEYTPSNVQLGDSIANRGGEVIRQMGEYEQLFKDMDPWAYGQEAADAMYRQQERYLTPQQEQLQAALEARLAEQGFTPGGTTPGYTNEMDNFRSAQERAYADARDRAILTGADVGATAFANRRGALESAVGANLSGANYNLNESQARQAAAAQAAQLALAQEGMNWGRQLDIAGLNRQAALDNNAVLNQIFNQGLAVDNLGRTAQLDANAVAQQFYGNNMANIALENAAKQSQFGADMGGYEAGIRGMEAENAASQQALARALQERQLPLQELATLMGYTAPTQQSPAPQQAVPGMAGVDVMGAYDNKYQGDLAAYNAKVAQQNQWLQMLGMLGGAAITGGALGGAGAGAGAGATSAYTAGSTFPSWAVSDIRLKDNIRFTGKTPGGANLYSWDWKEGFEEITQGQPTFGVIAQEVPEAAFTGEDGYLRVDYSKVS